MPSPDLALRDPPYATGQIRPLATSRQGPGQTLPSQR